MAKKKLGEILVERGSVSAPDLESALNEQRGKTVLLGDLLLRRGHVNRDDLANALEEMLRIEYVDVRNLEGDPELSKLVPRPVAIRNTAVPVRRDGGRLVVAMADPQNLRNLDDLKFSCGVDISPRIGFRDDIAEAIERMYAGAHKASSPKTPPAAKKHEEKTAHGKTAADTRNVVRTSPELMHSLTDLRRFHFIL